MPGDTMYPKEVSLSKKLQIDKSDVTIHKYREMAPIKNRMEYWDKRVKIIITDVDGKDNHVEFSLFDYETVKIVKSKV